MFSLNAVSWAETHVAAFEYFGGVPARLVPDNLRTGVDRPDLYDPKINRSYGSSQTTNERRGGRNDRPTVVTYC